MYPRPAPPAPGFAPIAAAMAGQPLHEFGPAEPGAETAALGFALGLAAMWAGPAGVFWAGEECAFAEDGAPYPPGLAQFGLDPAKLVVVRAGKREDALWAVEQGLAAPGGVIVCSLAARGKRLDLKATRRLLLFAERNHARCLLVRPLGEASAAWTRWRVASAPSSSEARELGPPAFALELVRSRGAPAGACFIVDWNADARCFEQRDVARDLSAASVDRPADPIRARA